ncbi:MAG TPA: carboxypeptidase-like regulatory domain-containing protein [Gemmatimonadales bacterium]|nr:carboxypeptidase-like regulatory domain-containing protein [Gemmatimonadales bacterium]
MKTALNILSALTLVGCAGENPYRLPTYPEPPPDLPPGQSPSLTSLWGMVVAESGVCIVGATVTVVKGQSLGQTITQTTPCDAWDYANGFVFRNLTAGVEMTLRSSAMGYEPVEKIVVPHFGAQTAVILAPSPIR